MLAIKKKKKQVKSMWMTESFLVTVLVCEALADVVVS